MGGQGWDRAEFARSEWSEEEGKLPQRSGSNKKEHPRGGAAWASSQPLPAGWEGPKAAMSEEPTAWEGQDGPWDHTGGEHDPPKSSPESLESWKGPRNCPRVAGRDRQCLSQTLQTSSASNISGKDLHYNGVFLYLKRLIGLSYLKFGWNTRLPKFLISKGLHTPQHQCQEPLDPTERLLSEQEKSQKWDL